MPPDFDDVVTDVATYCCRTRISPRAIEAAHLPLIDALACALLAATDPECRGVIDPPFGAVPNAPARARVIGTPITASPVDAAFGTGALVRWLDFNDTWLAREWAHPSDNLGALLPLCDFLGTPTVADLLESMARAYEIQGALAVDTALNRHGLDHTAFARVASAATCARLLGGNQQQVAEAIAHAFADAGSLRVYRHAPNVTWRKSWAAGDAAARGLWLAHHALRAADAPRRPLTTPRWGLSDALLDGDPVRLAAPLGTAVIENVLLKPAFPAEYHGQSAVEAALALHTDVAPEVHRISAVDVHTCEAAMRIIDKTGPLTGHADRDHCLQYMVAVALIHGELTESHYGATTAADPRIDALRARIHVTEDPSYTRSYHDPARRAVPSRIAVHLPDGRIVAKEVRYPLGHPRRRAEAAPYVETKLRRGVSSALGRDAGPVADTLMDLDAIRPIPVRRLVDLLVPGEG